MIAIKGWYSSAEKYQELEDTLNQIAFRLDILSEGRIDWQLYRSTSWIKGELTYPTTSVVFRLRELQQEEKAGIAMDTILLPVVPPQSAPAIKQFSLKLDALLLLQIKSRFGLAHDGVHFITSVFEAPVFPRDDVGYTLKKVQRMYVLNQELGAEATDCLILLQQDQISVEDAFGRFYTRYRQILSQHSIPFFDLETTKHRPKPGHAGVPRSKTSHAI